MKCKHCDDSVNPNDMFYPFCSAYCKRMYHAYLKEELDEIH